jgi:beta-mannosidase
MGKINLDTDWKIRHEELAWGTDKQLDVLQRAEGWMTAALPCDVHMPLIENGIIKEPLEADHCFESEWVEDRSWWFKKEFTAEAEFLNGDAVELHLEALDVEADVFLNGYHLGHHKSAFHPYVKDVKKFLREGLNVLLVRVTSGLEHVSDNDLAALKDYISMEPDTGKGRRGDKRRAFVRKPQYAYGWDWGPRVASCGIVKGAWLESLSRLSVRSVFALTKSTEKDAEVEFQVEVENLHSFSSMDAILRIEILCEGEKAAFIEKEVFLRSGLNYYKIDALIADAKLWWPNGMGAQNLYDVKVCVAYGDAGACYPGFKFGIRTIRLNQDRVFGDERGFAIEINGIKTFCKGGNWIPADSIYARVTDEKYDTLTMEARNANFNMLRVWGGGIYERDIFYRKCDEYGIMLWHDFMFSCAMYPDNLEWFRDEVEKEMDYQTKRLRNHPSMVLWCGNNENTWAFDEWWLDAEKRAFLGGAFCYNNLAPKIVNRNCPHMIYWNSSPYGGIHPNGNETGDRHHWFDCMMNPDMEKRIAPEEYDKVTAKFVSEYGYVGPCRKSTIEKYHGGLPLDRSSKVWQLHNNNFEKDTVAAGIAKHYTNPEQLGIDDYLQYAGLCQGLMYGYSLEALRFKDFCQGALFWMYNDCWGEVGWTIIDYYLRRKISYYFVKRAFAPVKVILRENNGKIQIVGINETDRDLRLEVEYGYTSLDGAKKVCNHSVIELKSRVRCVVLEFTREAEDFTKGLYYIKEVEGRTIQPAVARMTAFRNLDVPASVLTLSNWLKTGDTVEFDICSNAYAHAVHFGLDDDIRLSDEYFDLLPGETRRITIYSAPEDFSMDDIKPRYVKHN